MSTNAIADSTPYYVLMDVDGRVGPKVVPLDTGIECAPIYGFSHKGPYDIFCTNSEKAFKPYPLIKGYLRNQIEAPGDGLKLVVLDAPGPGELSLRAATMEAVLDAQEKRTPNVNAAYRLLLDQTADAYRVDEAPD